MLDEEGDWAKRWFGSNDACCSCCGANAVRSRGLRFLRLATVASEWAVLLKPIALGRF